MKIAVVYCLHGDEKYGEKVALNLPPSIDKIIGNPEAFSKNKRFIETDLNRCFPGNPAGTYEERRASELKEMLEKYDIVIDLHSTSNVCPLFGIITSPNAEKIALAKRLGLNKLVIMPEIFAKGKALIDHVKGGISLEIGPHDEKSNIDEVLDSFHHLINNEQSKGCEIFEVVNIIKKEASNSSIFNFQEVKKGQLIAEDALLRQYADHDFTAILVDEKAYKDILCFSCKKL